VLERREEDRMKSRALRGGFLLLSVVALTAVALPIYRGTQQRGCQPENWIDWHLAMRQQCLTPQYVCDNMTTAKMLRDPDLAAAYRQGIAAGVADPVPMLAEMVGRMRRSYGCAPESDREGGSTLPGPLRGSGPQARPSGPFQPPPSVTL
jgi:hypothetical protein